MIASQGLLNPAANDVSDKELAYRLGTAAWHKYRHEAIRTKPHGLRAIFRAVIEDLPRFTSRKLDDKDLLPVADIHAIAVWDTVGSLGIPKYDGQDERVDTFRFTDESLSVKVVNAFHAVAVDELRKDFAPTLWNANGKTNVKQVLFPGAHADVGGGYSWAKQEAGLSDVALEWMRGELNESRRAVRREVAHSHRQGLCRVCPFAACERHFRPHSAPPAQMAAARGDARSGAQALAYGDGTGRRQAGAVPAAKPRSIHGRQRAIAAGRRSRALLRRLHAAL
jgi:hypothetical protein